MEISLPIYIAALDGVAPDGWAPFAQSRLRELATQLTPARTSVGGLPVTVRTRLMLRHHSTIEAGDTPAIVGALVDGRDFSGGMDCPSLKARANQLHELAEKLAAHPTPFYRKYGFKTYVVCPEALEFPRKLEVALQGAMSMELDIPSQQLWLEKVESEAVLVHLGRQLARTFASNLPHMGPIPGFSMDAEAT